MCAEHTKILLIRGSPHFKMRLAQTLGQGFSIYQTDNEEKILRDTQGQPPEVVLFFPKTKESSDLFPPALKEFARSSTIPVIILPKQGSAKIRCDALREGAADCFVSPFFIVELVMRIRMHLALKRAHDEIETQRQALATGTRDLMRARYLLLKGMASLAETRDPETGDHLLRVHRYMWILAKDLCHRKEERGYVLRREALSSLSKAAILHDIGKVGVRDDILLKPGRLTPEEYEEIKKHTEYGERIIRSLVGCRHMTPFLKYAGDIAGSHHESWNGKGYPRGLAGTDIPLSARLTAVADVYDSIVSPRVYKKAQGHNDAVEFIMDNKGIRFDPVIADIFHRKQKLFANVVRRFVPRDLNYVR